MLQLILFLFQTVSQALVLSPAERIFKCEENVMKIFENPQENDGRELMRNLKEYISIVNRTTEDFKEDEGLFNVCRTIRLGGWTEFLLCDLNATTLNEFKNKFKWNDKQFKEFQSLMRTAEEVWMNFMEYFYQQIDQISS